MDLLNFSTTVKVPPDFDAPFYLTTYPETKDFYQPFAKETGISEAHRLYFHFLNYGRKSGYCKNEIEKRTIDSFYKHLFDPSKVDPDFDEFFYEKMYQETEGYYQPFCDLNGIGKRERLYRHYKSIERGSPIKIFRNEQELAARFEFIKTPSQPQIKNPNVAVIAHAYYQDVWENELSKEIQSIELDYDLLVTIPQSNPGLAQQVKEEFPDAEILLVENRGADVWPFIQSLRLLASRKKQYDFFLKLQTKKSEATNPLFTTYLRRGCYQNLCRNINFILSEMTASPTLGMVGAPNTRVIFDREEDKENLENFDQIRTALKLHDNRIDFIFGTMFVVRENLFECLLSSDVIRGDLFEEGHRFDGTVAHAFERIFSNIVRSAGQKIALLDELIEERYP